MNTISPSLTEFFARAERAFRFLEDEYGFVKQSSSATAYGNPFHVLYENPTTAVIIEGVSWGSAAIAYVGRKGGRSGINFELVPLWTLARLEGAGREDALTVPGQAAQIEASAAALPRLARAALQGEFAAIDAARTYLEERVREASKA
jgi:hypothetical protein